MKNIIKELIKNPLFSGSLVMILGSNSVSFVNYLYHLIVGRMLGPSGYGELASLISIIGLLGIIPASCNLVIIKYISEERNSEQMASLIGWFKTKALLASLFFIVIILILSPFISSFLKIPNGFYLWLIALSFLFSIRSLVNRSILQGLLKFKEMVLSMLIENGSKLLFTTGFIFIGLQVSGAMIAYVLAGFIGLYMTNVYLKSDHKVIKISVLKIKSMLIFTIPVLIQSFSTTSIYSSDVILVKHFFSPHEAGIYASLSTLGKIIFFGAGPIAGVMFPLISKRKSRGEGFKNVFIYSFVATCLFATIVSGFYMLFPRFAINLLFGSAYIEAASLLIWFAVFIGLFTLSSLLINFALSLGKTSIVIFPFIAAIVQIILILLMHKNLFTIVLISVSVNALLLLTLLIYLTLEKVFTNGKQIKNGNKINFNNSPGI